jgi:phage terminase small subunit
VFAALCGRSIAPVPAANIKRQGLTGNKVGKLAVMALSPKQSAFVEEYLRCWNATDAYQAVYPKSSRDAARAHAARLVANGSVAEEIQRRIDERAMSANEVLDRLAEQARAAYSAYLTAAGVDLQRMIADGKAHLIKGIKETAHGRVIEFHDAQTALVQLGKHHKLFVDKVDVNHSGKIEHSNVTELTDEELADIASRRSGGTAHAQDGAA